MTEIIGAEYVESKGNTHYYNYSPVSVKILQTQNWNSNADHVRKCVWILRWVDWLKKSRDREIDSSWCRKNKTGTEITKLIFKEIIFNNYLTILTEPSIFTRSDLNRMRKETIKKRLVWLTGEFMHEHEAVNSGCAKVRSLQYLQTWQMIVLIFLYQVLQALASTV